MVRPRGEPVLFRENALVDPLEFNAPAGLESGTMIDHLLGLAHPVDQRHAWRDPRGCLERQTGSGGRVVRLVTNSGGERAVDILKGFKNTALDVLTDQVSIFGVRSALEAGPHVLRRLLLGAATDALLAGGDAERIRRNRLQNRAVAIALAQALANADIRQTRLPPSQSVLLTPSSAAPGNSSLTTEGFGNVSHAGNICG